MVLNTERIYRYCPVAIQNLGISLFGLAWRHERLGGRFHEYCRSFMERDRWPIDRFDRWVQQELRKTLLRAFERVPYYRQAWHDAGISIEDLKQTTPESLSCLPATRKGDLRKVPTAFIAEDLVNGARLRFYQTSGTTGTPIAAVCTVEGHRQFIAAREARSFKWAGTSVEWPRSMIGGRMVVPKGWDAPPFHRYNLAEKQVYFSAFHISPRNVVHYTKAMNRYCPRVFTGYAYSHYLLAKMMLEQGLCLNYQPGALILGSEKLTDEMRRVITEAFRAPVYEEYGCVENCVLATECECGGLHVSPDFAIVEVVDERGRPVPKGVEGRILCTSLLNEAQPLIRYEIGDFGTWSTEECRCGRAHLPVLKEVVGRLEDVVTGPDGRQMVRFHGIFVNLPAVLEGQVIQEALDRFTVKVVTEEGYGATQEEVIRKRFEERLGRVHVCVQRVQEIPRTERGKFRAVISKV